jgi:hypothetical protein
MPGRNNLPTDGNGRIYPAMRPKKSFVLNYDSGVPFFFGEVGSPDVVTIMSTSDCLIAFDDTVHSGSHYLTAYERRDYHVTGYTGLFVQKVSEIGKLYIGGLDY